MKPLRKDNIHEWTATVGELIKAVQKYDPDTVVACTWEGTICPLDVSKIDMLDESAVFNTPIVLIDAEG
jgi:hypothetical protein